MTTQFHFPFPIYLSGPMFSAADLWSQQSIADTLERPPTDAPFAPTECYLPQRDGIEVGSLMHYLNSPTISSGTSAKAMGFVRRAVYALDMYQLLDRCGAVVFNMDGRVPDGGSVVEAASAYVSGRVIVIYKSTPITMLGGWDNPMISGLSTTWTEVQTFADIPTELIKRLADTTEKPEFRPSRELADVVSYGHIVWDLMQVIRAALKGITTAIDAVDPVRRQEVDADADSLVTKFVDWCNAHLPATAAPVPAKPVPAGT